MSLTVTPGNTFTFNSKQMQCLEQNYRRQNLSIEECKDKLSLIETILVTFDPFDESEDPSDRKICMLNIHYLVRRLTDNGDFQSSGVFERVESVLKKQFDKIAATDGTGVASQTVTNADFRQPGPCSFNPLTHNETDRNQNSGAETILDVAGPRSIVGTN